MSDTGIKSALQGQGFTGLINVEGDGLQGMISLRARLDDNGLSSAIAQATGTPIPEAGRIETAGAVSLAWMSPDELLVLTDYDKVSATLAALETGLADQHYLALDVSDARASISLRGEGRVIRDVLAKLTPADLRGDVLPLHQIRRTRLAQIPAAFWFEDPGHARLICFRSVAQYAFDLLANASQNDTSVDHF